MIAKFSCSLCELVFLAFTLWVSMFLVFLFHFFSLLFFCPDNRRSTRGAGEKRQKRALFSYPCRAKGWQACPILHVDGKPDSSRKATFQVPICFPACQTLSPRRKNNYCPISTFFQASSIFFLISVKPHYYHVVSRLFPYKQQRSLSALLRVDVIEAVILC